MSLPTHFLTYCVMYDILCVYHITYNKQTFFFFFFLQVKANNRRYKLDILYIYFTSYFIYLFAYFKNYLFICLFVCLFVCLFI